MESPVNTTSIGLLFQNILKNKHIILSGSDIYEVYELYSNSLVKLRKQQKQLKVFSMDLLFIRDETTFFNQILHTILTDYSANMVDIRKKWSPEAPPLLLVNGKISAVSDQAERYIPFLFSFLEPHLKKKQLVFSIFHAEHLLDFRNGNMWKEIKKYSIKSKIQWHFISANPVKAKQLEKEYKSTEMITVLPPFQADWIKYIKHTLKVNASQAGRIAVAFDRHTTYTLQYINALKNVSGKPGFEEKDLQLAYFSVLSQYEPLFEEIIRHINNTQLNLLKAVAANELRMTSTRVMQQYALGTPRNVAKNKEHLISEGILRAEGSYLRFVDPAFAAWLKLNL